MDECINGRGGKEFIGKPGDEFGDQDRLCREHQITVQAAFGVQTDEFDSAGICDL